MLFGSAALRHTARLAPRAAAAPSRQLRRASGGVPAPLLSGWYRIFGHSSIGYATWLVGGIIVAEGLTGYAGDAVWNSVNAGRTYETVDWEQFRTDDEDDEDDDDEDEDDEEEGEDDDNDGGDDDDDE